ncbi:MAG: glycosyltransferase [Candidatus Dormibacteraeota bacterium]|nr:glycosyltransferase [Candidatus Dormibacteraeota bacterium]
MALARDLPDLIEVPSGLRSPARVLDLLTGIPAEQFRNALGVAHDLFAGRVIWNVNSTASGGGVAEMLQSIVPYARGAGVDTRWVVIGGSEEFFRITKRLHNRLHGAIGDGGELDEREHDEYLAVLQVNAERLLHRVHRGDAIVLHDPQTAGMIPLLHQAGHPVVWRCHVGVLDPNSLVHQAWDFLRPSVLQADAYIFSTHGFVWDGLDPARLTIVPPSIDPLAPKNNELTTEQQRAILVAAGLMAGDADPAHAVFTRLDGSTSQVVHRSELAEIAPLQESTPLVLQVSRWDRLKDPRGVLDGFVEYCAPASDAHLMLAGPSVARVADDPEGLDVLNEIEAAWRALPDATRARVHLASLQMNDVEENAVTVNALQRRAAVVVQKSLAEGFGLTVAEAMWKARPVVASRVGGIQDQIEDGRSGELVEPRDLPAFGAAVNRLLRDPALSHRIGDAARERVREHFLVSRHLLQYLELLSALLDREAQ